MYYAFRVFAAVYNHPVVETPDVAARNFFYGAAPPSDREASQTFWIPARYSCPQRDETRFECRKVRYADEDFYLLYGLDPLLAKPDWLGEIFEWLSSSLEQSIVKRDSVQRIPDSEMIFSRLRLHPWKPYAAMLMAWLENEACHCDRGESLPRAPSPSPAAEHLVICSHDVDYCYTGRASALVRLVKNLGISLLSYKSWSYFRSNLAMLIRLLGGNRVGDYLPRLLDCLGNIGIRSTFFVVPVHAHRRDPNYRIADITPQIKQALARGFSVELHASYCSAVESQSLQVEAQELRNSAGKQTLGSRQHWLRFNHSDLLFRQVEDAGLIFDSSMGFTDTVGFRNGACFAFPPYDFKNERPHNFLEFPLAIMDGSLIELSRATGKSPQTMADRVLQESRKRGWGGISILWHNPLEALSVPDEINQTFWNCAKARDEHREQWVSTSQFLSLSLPRYKNAGLLKDIRIQNLPETGHFVDPVQALLVPPETGQ